MSERSIQKEITYLNPKSVSVTARSKAHMVSNRSNIGILCSKPGGGMEVCPHFSVLCYSLWVEAFLRTGPPSKESYQNSFRSLCSVSEHTTQPDP